MGFFDRGLALRGQKQSNLQARLCIERLEDRTLLDASASLVSGTLFVTGGSTNERIDLSLDSTGTEIIVRDSAGAIGQFLSVDVSHIAIATGDGNDRVKIGTDILQPATIEGGAGNVVLEAGGGPTHLIAGPGTAKLIGGPAANVLIGGPGKNVLVGTSGQDTLQGGAGQNTFVVKGHDTVANVNATDHVFGQLASAVDPPSDPPTPPADLSPDPPNTVLTTTEVNTILQQAAKADPHNDAIIAVVDREGNVLGVRVEGNVSPAITGNTEKLVFAIDGALAEARTGAYFGNDQAPLTSRTIQFISQSTITQREVDSDPNIADPNSTVRGPGFVAPIGIGGHFPPNIDFTPQVDLFDIEGTNRDSAQGLPSRFNVPLSFIPGNVNNGAGVPAPESYGLVSGKLKTAQARGIGTLPGGVPIYKLNPADGQYVEVGGIGVFYPGTTGFASEENSSLSSNYDPTKLDKSFEAEAVALVAIGGSSQLSSASHPAGSFRFPTALPELDIPVPAPGRIDLVGVTLDIVGPGGREGPDALLALAQRLKVGSGNPNSGTNEPVDTMGDLSIQGTAVPEGWLVTPHDSMLPGGPTAADVIRIIDQGITEASQIRAAIRLPLDSTSRMVFAVSDKGGNILGLFRMPDATYFSIAVAVAKARNVAYYDDPTQLQAVDNLAGIAAGVAFTNRTFRYLAEPHFPEGINDRGPGPFSILNDGGVDPATGLNVGPPLPASAYQSVLGFDSFNPNTNFRQPKNDNQNGIVFFPGSSPLYRNGDLIGGLGVSGDGVDQDDDVTFFASNGYQPDANGVTRADQVFFHGVRLPFIEFNRNPVEPV